ncbi:hypothetical protein Tco_1484281 [Tanacetum coccineum]
MSTHEQHTPTVPTSAVRNTGGRSGPQRLEEPTPDEVLRELCDKNYHQLLPLIAEKMQKEKKQQDKLNAVKACLLYDNETGTNQRNHEESNYSESKTPTARTEPKRRHENRRSRSPTPVASVFKRLKQNRPPSPRPRLRKEGGVFNRLGGKERSASALSGGHHQSSHEKEIEVQLREHHHRGTSSWETGGYSESEDSEGGHWKSKSRRHRTRMPSHIKTYDGSGDPKDHLKLFQVVAKTERENYLHQTKHIKDPVDIHHIKQRDRESTEDFMERHKAEILDVEGAPECMKISGFMHGITYPELIKCLYEKILRSMDEMYRVTTSFLQGEVAAFSHNRFSLLTKTPKEIFALEKGKFKAPPPMVTPAEKRDPNKYCEFHADTGHSKDECMQLRKQVDEMIKSGKLSQFIKELKQSDKPKAQKKGETARKDKPLAILMIQQWERVAKQRVTQSFSPETTISFPSLGEEDGTEGPMINEAEIGGHFVHRIYVDGGASSEVLYEHCFVRLRPEVTISTQWNNRQNGHKKDPCRTIHGTRNVKIPSKKRNDMTGVPRHMAEHRLNVLEGCPPVRQKKRGQAPERNKAIQEEVEKLVDARIMKEVHYHSWLSNPVMVKKHDGSWRMCVDFKDLNKACPQDGYPLPEID